MLKPKERDGYVGLIKTRDIGADFDVLTYDDPVVSLVVTNIDDTGGSGNTTKGYSLTQDPVTGEFLLVVDRLRVRNILVTKETVMQQSRGISGNLYLSPVAKIKGIMNTLIEVGV